MKGIEKYSELDFWIQEWANNTEPVKEAEGQRAPKEMIEPNQP